MASINNLNGISVKDGKVIYSEKLENELFLKVILKYLPFYDGKNRNNYQESTSLGIETLITDGNITNWGNGVYSFLPAERLEQIKENEKFKPLKTMKSKQGFRIWEQDYGVKSYERKVIWLVEISKEELIKLI